MEHVFSVKNPKLILSEDMDDRLGFNFIFTGAVRAMRHPNAHAIRHINDPTATFDWLLLLLC